MLIAFRTDASFEIGSGHLMRCLTLADELAGKGHRCVFVIRSQPGNLSSAVTQRGHELVLLTPIGPERSDESISGLAHDSWLRGGMLRDAEDVINALQGRKPDWLVVDHYGIDWAWEEKLANHCSRIMAVDDLADRQHSCNLLLDQNLGRTPEHYLDLVPEQSAVLCGTRFALLRDEFAQWRDHSIRRKLAGDGRRLLINLGGVDQGNVTGRVLDALADCEDGKRFDIRVVMGASAPHLEKVKTQIEHLDLNVELLSGIDNMAEVMANSDLAIGAAGATAWERCCLGLPTLLLVIADNQKQGAAALVDTGAAMCISDLSDIPNQLCSRLLELYTQRSEFMRASLDLCDGAGASRVSDCLEELSCD